MSYAYVSKAANDSSTSATSISVTYAPSAGNVLILCSTTGSNQVISINDNLGTHNTFSAIGSQVFTANGQKCAAWYVASCKGGSTTFTASWVSSSNFNGIAVYEYSGLTGGFVGSAGGNDQASPGTGANALTSGTIATGTSVPAALIGICIDTSANTWPSAGSGFTGRGNDWSTSNGTLVAEDQRLTVSGSYAATYTAGTGTDEFCTFGVILSEGGGPTYTAHLLSVLGAGG